MELYTTLLLDGFSGSYGVQRVVGEDVSLGSNTSSPSQIYRLGAKAFFYISYDVDYYIRLILHITHGLELWHKYLPIFAYFILQLCQHVDDLLVECNCCQVVSYKVDRCPAVQFRGNRCVIADTILLTVLALFLCVCVWSGPSLLYLNYTLREFGA